MSQGYGFSQVFPHSMMDVAVHINGATIGTGSATTGTTIRDPARKGAALITILILGSTFTSVTGGTIKMQGTDVEDASSGWADLTGADGNPIAFPTADIVAANAGATFVGSVNPQRLAKRHLRWSAQLTGASGAITMVCFSGHLRSYPGNTVDKTFYAAHHPGASGT